MNKRLICLILAVLMLLSMTSCGLVDRIIRGENIFGPGEGPTEHEHSYVDGKCECGENDPNFKPEPPHEHNFVEGKCECGERDPNYNPAPEHKHSYVEGKCECGESDPNYKPPHEHSFVDGKCECGESDPNYKPPHEHNFVEGKCECGESDPNYTPEPPKPESTPTVYLAGDSTVKTYEDNQYIAGWGQFLSLFFSEDIIVVNTAHGGRSSRSFINEGRLYNIEGNNYSFSQNGGQSIEDCIKAGDYLLIQFGHNDDASKPSNYSSMYDRMVPLGEPDANGIYPVIPATKSPTTYLPEDYTKLASDSEENSALAEIAKYGEEYYAYGSGTYKWYLKQYIDFAREKGAIPVLVTPVARVKFNSEGEIIGGAGLHGENFAYVQAVRQLAEEEDCLLIDLFAISKEMLECATPTYANYLMAIKPNGLTGQWPVGYDSAYGNPDLGYEGIEATHYNKYGAYLQAAAVAEALAGLGEDHPFSDNLLAIPESYIDPSNLMGKNTALALEALIKNIIVTNPQREYYDPTTVVDFIATIPTEVTEENHLEILAMCEEARALYAKVNADDRARVINLSTLETIEAAVEEMIKSLRPEPTRTVIYLADDLQGGVYNTTVVEGGLTIVATSSKTMEKKGAKVKFSYADVDYSTTYGLSVGGSAKFGQYRYVSFTTDGACSVTIAVMSSSSSAVRTLAMVDAGGNNVGNYEAGASVTLGTVEISEAGTYSVGSTDSGMYIFAIIIEYYE